MAKTRRKSTPPAKPSTKSKAKPAKAASAAKPKARPAAKAKVPAKAAPKPKAKVVPAAKVPPRKDVKPAAKETPAPPPKVPARAKVAPAPPPPPPPRRSTYVDALSLYDRGVVALHGRKFREALDTLNAVIEQFPEEKELHERARLYIRVCERSLEGEPQKAESLDERVTAATVAINNGALEKAITILTAVLHKDAKHDAAAYMLGVAHALQGNDSAAIQHLSHSIALNPENRELAMKEPDLEQLRHTDEMRALLAARR